MYLTVFPIYGPRFLSPGRRAVTASLRVSGKLIGTGIPRGQLVCISFTEAWRTYRHLYEGGGQSASDYIEEGEHVIAASLEGRLIPTFFIFF